LNPVVGKLSGNLVGSLWIGNMHTRILNAFGRKAGIAMFGGITNSGIVSLQRKLLRVNAGQPISSSSLVNSSVDYRLRDFIIGAGFTYVGEMWVSFLDDNFLQMSITYVFRGVYKALGLTLSNPANYDLISNMAVR
jgi:hypothetical protein